jgi:signal transduction histidine kinase
VLAQVVEANRPLATERRVALSTVPPDALLPSVTTEEWALRRIVDNLVSNAIKFTEPGGSVEVLVRTMPDGIAVTVRDTGAGMPAYVIEQIGEPFFQAESGDARRFEGLGIGLALSLRLPDAIGATLHFDSTLGKGTTASLVLPLSVRAGGAGQADTTSPE